MYVMQIAKALIRIGEYRRDKFDQCLREVGSNKIMRKRGAESAWVGCQGNMTLLVDSQAFFLNTVSDAVKALNLLPFLQSSQKLL